MKSLNIHFVSSVNVLEFPWLRGNVEIVIMRCQNIVIMCIALDAGLNLVNDKLHTHHLVCALAGLECLEVT